MESHREFISPHFSSFVQNDKNLILVVNNSIINPLFPAPEPSLHYDSSLFDCWFGIPFKDSLHTIYTRAPHPPTILTLYNLYSLIPLYSSLLSSKYIRYLFLHTLPSCLSKNIASDFLSTILPPIILPPPFHQNMSSCFT